MKIDPLFVTPQWLKEYHTKYPHGQSVLENIIEWTNQVNLMVDQLNLTQNQIDILFTQTLPENVESVLNEWYASGILGDVINIDLMNGKVDKVTINIKDYGAIGDYYNEDGSINNNPTDNWLPIQTALDQAYGKPHTTVEIPPGVYMSTKELYIWSNTDLVFNNAIVKIPETSIAAGIFANAGNYGNPSTINPESTILAENIRIFNAHIDGSNYPNRNGFGFINAKNIHIYNPIVEGCRLGPQAGGKAFQFETGENGVNDITVYNPIIKNCSIGINAQGFTGKPSRNISVYNIMMNDVEIPFNFDSTLTLEGALSHNEMSILIDGFSLKNCGKIIGMNGAKPLGGSIIATDRAYGVTIQNGKIINDPDYGKIGGLIRGKGRNFTLKNIDLYGDVTALFNGNVKGFGSPTITALAPASYKADHIRHFGNCDYVVDSHSNISGHMKDCRLTNIKVGTIINGILTVNASTAANSFISMYDDMNNRIDLLPFENVYRNNLIIEKNNNFISKKFIHTKLVQSATKTLLFDVDMGYYNRLYIDFVISTNSAATTANTSMVVKKGIISAMSNNAGLISLSTQNIISDFIIQQGTNENILTIEFEKNETTKKITCSVTQTHPSQAQMVVVNADIVHMTGEKPTAPIITRY